MRILLTGATGLIGSAVAAALVDRGDQIIAHSRRRRPPKPGIHWLVGDGQDPDTYRQALATVDGVINLAGAPIACRWTPKARAEILRSRVDTTRALVSALDGGGARPKVWVNASAIGYYGPNPKGLCEESTPQGQGFLAEVCGAWEAAALGAQQAQVRLVRLRLGAVLAAHGGMLPVFVRAARALLGGPMGSGEQWMSWIHITDAVRLILWCLDEPEICGPVNAVAPNAARHKEFIAALGKVLNRPMWLRAPIWALGAALGDMAQELVLANQEVVPKIALNGGFAYRHPHLEAALHDLLGRP
jgi:uncharacterized protein (TIGR01777 family)